jgi:hypothetical protein
VEWWVKAAKQPIRKIFTRVGSEKRQEDRGIENLYFKCIYVIPQSPQRRLERMAEISMLKAKIVNLHSVMMEGADFGLGDRAAFNNEKATIYHIQQKTHREQWTITRILNQADRTHTTNKQIAGMFNEFLRSKFEPIGVDAECVRRIVLAGHGRLTEAGRETLAILLDLEEFRTVLQRGEGINPLGGMELFRRCSRRCGTS